jgi:hypothetical protein
MAIPPPPMPMHHPGTPTSALPISGERLSAHLNPNKKQRLMPTAGVKISNTSRASSDEQYTYQSPTQGPAPSPSFRSQQQQTSTSYGPYTSFPPTPQSFLVGAFDYTPPAPSPHASSTQSQRAISFPTQPRPSTYQDHQQGPYQQLVIRQQQHHPGQPHPHAGPPAADLFASLLEADEHTRQAQGAQSFVPALVWPMHGQTAGHRGTGAFSSLSLHVRC